MDERSRVSSCRAHDLLQIGIPQEDDAAAAPKRKIISLIIQVVNDIGTRVA